MARAVRLDSYGPVDVLDVVEVPVPRPGPNEVVVEVVTSSINPGEAKVRDGLLHEMWPATFPSGQGSDLAGVISAVGDGVDAVAVGDEVIGWVDTRSAQADYVVVPAEHLAAKPATLDWDQAGSLFVAGTTAYAAVRAVAAKSGETVAISGAAGGVGSIASQLLVEAGVRVLGIAGAANADYLRSIGVEPVEYGEGLRDRLRAASPDGLDAFIDTYGQGYVELALDLGVDKDRVETIADFPAVEKFGVKSEGGATAAEASVLTELADLITRGALTIPIAATYPLEQVRAAYTELADGHTRGKIVLRLR